LLFHFRVAVVHLETPLNLARIVPMKSFFRWLCRRLAAGFVAVAVLAFAGAAHAESRTISVATLKLMPDTGVEAKGANFERFEKLARRAAAAGAQLIVTPEGYLDGYLGAPKWSPGITHRKLVETGDTLDGKWLTRTAALARELKVHIIFCFAEKRGDKVFNTAAMFAPDGSLAGKYSKSHSVPGGELYDMGNELPVFDTALGRMGILICFDRQPPENARTLALKGAEFIVVPAYGRTSSPNDEDLLMRARAYENGIYVVYTSPLNAFVAAPDGDIVAQVRGQGDEILFADLVLDERIGDRNARIARRPELYEGLVNKAVSKP
jgi:5-aminopentanamidase